MLRLYVKFQMNNFVLQRIFVFGLFAQVGIVDLIETIQILLLKKSRLLLLLMLMRGH